jgi:hypothetical protein
MQFDQLKRREFITLLGGAAVAWPLAARAQQGERLRRIGVLMATAENDSQTQHRLAALRDGLQKLGWTEGRNLRSEYRWGENDLDRMRVGAEELAALKPEVIFAAPTSALVAMRRATSTIPIVFAQVADPVGQGLVASNSHPGGNLTGFATYEYAVSLKWVELLKQIAPQITRIAVLYDPEQPAAAGYVTAIEAAAGYFSVRVVPGAVRDAAAIERTIEAFAREPNGGLILPRPHSPSHTARSSFRWRCTTACRISSRSATTSRRAPLPPTASTISTSIAARRNMSIAFSGVKSPAICQSSLPPNSNWSSTSRPPKRLASTSRSRCSPAPTR